MTYGGVEVVKSGFQILRLFPDLNTAKKLYAHDDDDKDNDDRSGGNGYDGDQDDFTFQNDNSSYDKVKIDDYNDNKINCINVFILHYQD